MPRASANWIASEACGHARRLQINVQLREGRKPLVIALELRKAFPKRWPTDHAAEMMVHRWKKSAQFRAWLATQEDQDKLLRTLEAMELKLGLIGEQPEKRFARSLLLQIMDGTSADEEKAAAAATLIGAIGSLDQGKREDRKLQQKDRTLSQKDRSLEQADRKILLLEKKLAVVGDIANGTGEASGLDHKARLELLGKVLEESFKPGPVAPKPGGGG